jgi:hypothetical protein
MMLQLECTLCVTAEAIVAEAGESVPLVLLSIRKQPNAHLNVNTDHPHSESTLMRYYHQECFRG